MRVNGGKEGDFEAIGIFENGLWKTSQLNTKELAYDKKESVKKITKGRPKNSKNKIIEVLDDRPKNSSL